MSLNLESVSKIYGEGSRHPVHAVRTMDLEVKDGEIIALLGSSGCGKTSTLRMIAGFETVSSGTINLAGRRIDHLAPAQRRVAMAFEGYALYPPLTIAENIGFALRGDRTQAATASAQVKEVAELLEIGPILNRRPNGLSGGQQQRASLARALIRNAELHLLDEPMGQLEPQLRAVLRGRVKARIQERGYTAVLVTHDQGEANAMADRIAVMEAGVLQQYGTPAELRDRPANLFVATFFGEPPMNTLPGIVTEAGYDALDAAGAVALRIPVAAPRGLAHGRRVVLGLRPHRLHLGRDDYRGVMVSNQWLGDQAHVAIEATGRMLIAIHPTRIAARLGETIGFGFDPDDLHLFDAESGAALAHGAAS
ncbi:ABC transporter ATP-binding protein [Acidiphilium iwatense]|uniref:ABC transporter ATP-binding protein n=1 Tax=Acidiphilium iwatense TaxID=768198 RepID=A0ABS9E0L7_9PROT|nr:ABC transporter ATP-binding protein [Acidiphilium iwatense]MCF3947129.1 ABC transporter ATP-binding protein [Acidiphilium iwatense]